MNQTEIKYLHYAFPRMVTELFTLHNTSNIVQTTTHESLVLTEEKKAIDFNLTLVPFTLCISKVITKL